MPQADVQKTESEAARNERRKEQNRASARRVRAKNNAALEGMAQKVVELETRVAALQAENASLCEAVIILHAQLGRACGTFQANQGPVFNKL